MTSVPKVYKFKIPFMLHFGNRRSTETLKKSIVWEKEEVE
jgi:hypothetical protein